MAYESLVKDGATEYEVLRNLALCYWMLRDFEKAEFYAGRAANMALDPADLWLFAQAQKCNGQYAASQQTMAKYNSSVQGDSRAVDHLADPLYHQLLSEDGGDYLITDAGINTEHSDFGLTRLRNGSVVFASARGGSAAVRRTFKWDNTVFLDLYTARTDIYGQLTGAKSLSPKINTKYHEGPVATACRDSLMFFTRSNYQPGDTHFSADGVNRLKLYSARKEGNSWGEVTAFTHNSDEYSTGHPALSADGKTLYFASDRPGGFGGSDIYVSHFVRGMWTKPSNLGVAANTAGDELFPWLDADGTLYFASDGWAGLGGLDLFEIRPDSSGWSATNMGAPFNSPSDDFAVSFSPDHATGYLSSNRPGGKGSDDIYRFFRNPLRDMMVKGVVINTQDGSPIAGAEVVITSARGDVVAQMTSGTSGAFAANVDKRKCPLHIRVENGDDWSVFDATDMPCNAVDGVADLGYTPISPLEWLARGRIIDLYSGQPLTDTEVTLSSPELEHVQHFNTGPKGVYQVHLSPGAQYEMKLEKPGYFTRVDQFVAPESGKDLASVLEPEMQPYTVGQGIELKNIHYDFDQHYIRRDAAMELDKLLKILLDNPTLVVELGSHTDARGDDSYDLALSERRAQAAVNYLVQRGISSARLTYRGYGETQLRNTCRNGATCPDWQHEQNRRTEFTVLGS